MTTGLVCRSIPIWCFYQIFSKRTLWLMDVRSCLSMWTSSKMIILSSTHASPRAVGLSSFHPLRTIIPPYFKGLLSKSMQCSLMRQSCTASGGSYSWNARSLVITNKIILWYHRMIFSSLLHTGCLQWHKMICGCRKCCCPNKLARLENWFFDKFVNCYLWFQLPNNVPYHVTQ